MLGLGSSMMKHPVTGKSIVRDGLVLQHNYNLSSVEPLSSGAASFDGTDDYISIGDIGAVKSLAFWFNPGIAYTSSVDGDRIIAFAGNSYFGMTIGAATGGLTGEVLTVLPDSSSRTATITTFTANTWYHVCISWNASNSYFDIYIDGVLSTDLSTGTHTLSNWDNFNVGADNTGSGAHFGGYMCNIGVWSATLDQPQIKSIMNKNYAGLTSSEKEDLVSWWNLSADANDNHGSNNGTLS